VVILKAAAGEPIPLYGDGLNVRDWLYVEDHVDALLLAACQGEKVGLKITSKRISPMHWMKRESSTGINRSLAKHFRRSDMLRDT
jgi:nucleoside-diphosphate-sugar epimerase